jgi:hypothetical protein
MTNLEINMAIAEGRFIADFCNDDKAMIIVEKWLMDIDPQSWDEYYCLFEKGLCSSSTRQRAENFVKVIGKWKE